VLVVEPGGGPPLLVEPLDDLGVARLLGRQQLQGDMAIEPGVERAEDRPHPADADRLLELERLNPLSGLGIRFAMGSAPDPGPPYRGAGSHRRRVVPARARTLARTRRGRLPRACGCGSL